MDIVDLLNKGSQTIAGLDDAACLQKAAEQFLGAYAMFDGCAVVAASSIAERVLGAAMMLNPEIRAGGVGCTVIFDVNVASGTQLARTARRLRDSGNSEQLVGIALHTLVEWEPNAPLGELSQLVVAHAAGENDSGRWEGSDRGDCSFEPALR